MGQNHLRSTEVNWGQKGQEWPWNQFFFQLFSCFLNFHIWPNFIFLRSSWPRMTSNDLEFDFTCIYYFLIFIILLYFLYIYMIKERVNFSGQNFASFLNPAESFRREFRIFNFSFLEAPVYYSYSLTNLTSQKVASSKWSV